MDWGIRDSVVVITGAANGIGRATADVYAAEGVVVALVFCVLVAVFSGVTAVITTGLFFCGIPWNQG